MTLQEEGMECTKVKVVKCDMLREKVFNCGCVPGCRWGVVREQAGERRGRARTLLGTVMMAKLTHTGKLQLSGRVPA